jgi:hypothetical protein
MEVSAVAFTLFETPIGTGSGLGGVADRNICDGSRRERTGFRSGQAVGPTRAGDPHDRTTAGTTAGGQMLEESVAITGAETWQPGDERTDGLTFRYR